MYSEEEDSELFAVAPDNLSTAKTVPQLQLSFFISDIVNNFQKDHAIIYHYTRAIQKVISIYFRQLMEEWGRAHACKVVSHDSVPYKHHITGHLMLLPPQSEL